MAQQALPRLKQTLARFARRTGYDIMPFDPRCSSLARRKLLFKFVDPDVVLDVGANTGQFANELRNDIGFGGRICSFEPLREPFGVLQALSAKDPKWSIFNFGLGDLIGQATINVAANSESSSLLTMLSAHMEAAPGSRFVATEEIAVRTLDSVFEDVRQPGECAYLKIDTQGYEGRVLEGGERSLASIDTIQVEMPLTPLYDGEWAFGQLFEFMLGKGYEMVGLEPAFADPQTGRLLQVDGIYHRATRGTSTSRGT